MMLFVTYGLGCASFLILIGLMLVNRKPRQYGLRLFLLCAITAVWAGMAAFQDQLTPGLVHAVGGLKTWAWIAYLASLFHTKAKTRNTGRLLRTPLIVGALAGLSFANDLRFVLTAVNPTDYDVTQVFGRVVLAVVGLVLVENLVRNTLPTRRWQVVPFAIAAGFLFAYDLYVYAEALVVRSVDISLLAGSGIVLVLMVPPLVVTILRNEDWRIDIHVSRNVVFHTATLTAGGLFLLVAAGIAGFIGRLPGEWGPILKVAFFCGCAFILVSAMSVEKVRSRLRRLLTENFFSMRFDYRTEWMRFVDTISAAESYDTLQVRAIRTLANVVDSPAGVLWLESAPEIFEPATFLNMRLGEQPKERADGAFFAKFEHGKVIQKFDHRGASAEQPAWVANQPIWLAVPLLHRDHITGFVTLAPPRALLTLNWESYELLSMIGRQVASYLSEERATSALVEAKSMIDHNKRFAFIIHDIKNLANQLGLMVANAKRLGDREEFRVDMMASLENSVERLGALLNRLQPGGAQAHRDDVVDPVPIMRIVAKDASGGEVSVAVGVSSNGARVRIDAESLRSVLTHLVSNAIDASSPGDTVTIHLHDLETRAVLEIRDQGVGMSPTFIRDKLFKPLQSTKERGHGIGAFQAREIVRSVGGDLEVVSAEGKGTTMRVILPRVANTDRQMGTAVGA